MSLITLEEQTAPSTPGTDKVRIYPKSDGLMYSMDDAGNETLMSSGTGAGDVVGPASAGDNNIARFSTTTGKLIQDSSASIDDSGNITAPSLIGGTGSGGDLTLSSTSNVTKGEIIFGSSSGMVFDEVNSRLSVGQSENTVTIGGASLGSRLTIDASGGTDLAEMVVHRHSDNANYGAHILYSRSRGSHASETIVQSGDVLGRVVSIGYDGTDYEQATSINFEVDGTPGAGDMPGRIVFNVSPDGSASPAEALRISQDKSATFAGAVTSASIALASGATCVSILDEDDLSTDSDTALATQQSIKAYVDSAVSGAGDVVGPASSTTNAITLYSDTTGKLVKNSVVLIDSDGRISQESLGLGVIIGKDAGLVDDLTTNYTTAIGANSLKANTSGRFNTCVGYRTMEANITQSNNTCVGYNVMAGAVGSTGCVGVGSQALALLSSGDNNISIGANSMLFTNSGSSNVGIGSNALYSNTTGTGNTGVGHEAGYNNATSSYNTCFGFQAGKGGSGNRANNVFIGALTAASVTTGSNNIVIGYNQDVTSATVSNELNIGGVLYGDLSNKYLGVNVTTSFAATLDVDQDSASGAVPVLRLNQTDIDDTFINFVGTTAADGSRSISTDTTEDSAKYGAIRVEINGTTKWIRIYDSES